MAVEIIHAQRGLHEVQIAFLELPQSPDRCLAIEPAIAHINHENHFVSQRVPGQPHKAYDVGVRINVGVNQLKLDGAELHVQNLLHHFLRLALCLRKRREGNVHACVRHDCVTAGAAQEFKNRSAKGLSGEVP